MRGKRGGGHAGRPGVRKAVRCGARSSGDLAETVRFHGHMCPGLVIGYRATKEALARLGARRAEDEEIVAIVENDSCSVDAVQWLSGCTFGKGNFFFRDYGKQVFTFALRGSGRAVRVALKPSAFGPPGGPSDGGGRGNRDRGPGGGGQGRAFRPEEREAITRRLLKAPAEELFDIRETRISLPPKAVIHESVVCERCGEAAMATRIVRKRGRAYCIPCTLKRGARQGRWGG
ncbi:MAG: FmdE family protein [Planctomycetota bacterium]|nr:FmdE family protein [Planctomycetota bacterium]